MNKGDVIDPIALGHQAIDVKGLLVQLGYVVPQASIAKLTKIPAEVEAQVEALVASRELYETQQESVEFLCEYCGEKNSSNYKKEKSTGTVFLVCGSCNKVVEVK
jgi:predicted RNA-binding Zn-ribbon protein involved in translation (DUF1610 family)